MVTIYVEQWHIDKGKPAECGSCPVALAVKDVLRESFLVNVGMCTVAVFTDDGSQSWGDDLPEVANRFIDRFDLGMRVSPFSFELPIPEEFLR